MNPKMIMDTAKGLVEGNSKRKNSGLIWFVTEIFQMIIFVIGAILLLWLYAPYAVIAKIIITIISMIVVYDVFKNFVYVRWILWKEGN